MKKTTGNLNESIAYLRAYGVDKVHGDLLYRQLSNGKYIVAWKSAHNIDIYLCKWLPDSHEDLNDEVEIKNTQSFDSSNPEKVAAFKEFLSM